MLIHDMIFEPYTHEAAEAELLEITSFVEVIAAPEHWMRMNKNTLVRLRKAFLLVLASPRKQPINHALEYCVTPDDSLPEDEIVIERGPDEEKILIRLNERLPEITFEVMTGDQP